MAPSSCALAGARVLAAPPGLAGSEIESLNRLARVTLLHGLPAVLTPSLSPKKLFVRI